MRNKNDYNGCMFTDGYGPWIVGRGYGENNELIASDWACQVYLGFQSESIKHSLDAPIRFNPTPPAFELSRNKTVAFTVRRCHKPCSSTYISVTAMTY